MIGKSRGPYGNFYARNGIYCRAPYFLGFSGLRVKKNGESHGKADEKMNGDYCLGFRVFACIIVYTISYCYDTNIMRLLYNRMAKQECWQFFGLLQYVRLTNLSGFRVRVYPKPSPIFLYINILAACSWSIVFPEIRTYHCKSMLEKSGLYMECIRIVI